MADLNKVNLQGANLWEVDLQKAILAGANLQGASFRKANLQETYLMEANLKNADLQEARGLTAEQVAEAIWDETTRWPEGFFPPPLRKEKDEEEK